MASVRKTPILYQNQEVPDVFFGLSYRPRGNVSAGHQKFSHAAKSVEISSDTEVSEITNSGVTAGPSPRVAKDHLPGVYLCSRHQ